MADPQYIYAQTPEGQVKRALKGTAFPEGWKPATQDQYNQFLSGGQQQAQPQGQMPGVGGYFLRGLNPFHMPPANTPKGTTITPDVIQDMFNAREATALSGSGHHKESAALIAGTATQNLLGGKAIEGVGKGIEVAGKSLESAQGVRSAMEFARTIKGHIPTGTGVSGAALNRALRYIEPLRNEVNKAYEAFHTQMSGQMLATSPTFSQIVRKMAGAGEPAIKNLAKDLTEATSGKPRSALDYKEAEAWRQKAMKIMKDPKLKGWTDYISRLQEDLDQTIDQAAQQVGLGARRDWLKQQWNKLVNLGVGVAATAEEKPTTTKKVLGTAVGAGAGALATGLTRGTPEGMVVGGLVGERAAASTKYVLHEGMKQDAHKMAKELGVKLSEEPFSGSHVMRGKVGRGLQKSSKAAVPATRAVVSGASQAFGDDQ